jgi:hypothetical protein
MYQVETLPRGFKCSLITGDHPIGFPSASSISPRFNFSMRPS